MITIQLPEGVSQPSLTLWSKACYKGEQYTVVGIHYVDDATAFIENMEQGWRYSLSNVWGINEIRDLRQVRADEIVLTEEEVRRLTCPASSKQG